jgi:glycosyltransferase involved in cell wall biosynthesis
VIIVNGVPLLEGTAGVARHARAALAAIGRGPHAHEAEIWLPSALAPSAGAIQAVSDLPIRIYPGPHPRRGFSFNQLFWTHCLAWHRCRHFRHARVFSPIETYSALSLGHPLITAHDCYADHFGDPARGGHTGWGRKLCVRQLRRSRVLAVSRFTAGELETLHGLKSPQVLTVPNWLPRGFEATPGSAQIESVRIKLNLPPRFWLYCGGFRRNKNLPLLLRAYAATLARIPETPPLVLAGRWPENDTVYTGSLNTVLAGLGERFAGRILRPGFVAEESLPSLYRLAELAICPSSYEGFGYPVIEAAAVGTPLLAARAAALPEVWPHPELLFSPETPVELVSLLSRIAREGAAFARRPLSPEFEYKAGEARFNAAVTTWLKDDE